MNRITFEVYGKYALFTDPITRIGGEKTSYCVPTYQALKGIVEGIYWKPTLIWVIDRVRVMKLIQTETKAVKTLRYNKDDKFDLSYYTYLKDVKYQVEAHFEWNMSRPDLCEDRKLGKHSNIVKRMLNRGGNRPIFLGTSECGGYVLPCVFGEGDGDYDEIEELSFGTMFHGFDYPTETGKEELYARLWQPVMRKGVIEFIRPSECTMRRFVRKMPLELPKTKGVDYCEVYYALDK